MKFHPKPVIYGIESFTLSAQEKKFFAAARPFGFILFSRNIRTAEQIRQLTDELREFSAFSEALVFIDQEGGRVARITPPIMPNYPPARAFGKLYEADAEQALIAINCATAAMAAQLQELGIRANCAPVCDIATSATHKVIGDRAFADDATIVSTLAAAQMQSFMAHGVLPVIKHIPGHGRATADSHNRLPKVSTPLSVLKNSDFIPFRHLRNAPFAMTAHIVYSDIDSTVATLSARLIKEVIREHIGFGGLLMSDDLSMGALSGRMENRAAAAIAAGCDLILHCNGDSEEMHAIDAVMPEMAASALAFYTDIREQFITQPPPQAQPLYQAWETIQTRHPIIKTACHDL